MSEHRNLCGEFTGSSIDLDTGEVRAGAIWCKCWTCEHCAPIRHKQLQAQAAQGRPSKFITLTHRRRPDQMTPDEAARQLVHAWRMAIQRGKREGLIAEMQYIAVFELTEKGWPHLHILARSNFLPFAWLRDRMLEYIDSPRVNIKPVRSAARAAWYIAKYIQKAPGKFQGCKRYWRTLSYTIDQLKPQKPLQDARKGVYTPAHVTFLAGFYESHSYTLEWTSEHSFVAVPQGLDVWATERAQRRRETTKPYKRK